MPLPTNATAPRQLDQAVPAQTPIPKRLPFMPTPQQLILTAQHLHPTRRPEHHMAHLAVPRTLLSREAYPSVHRRAPLLLSTTLPAANRRQRSTATQSFQMFGTAHSQQVQRREQNAPAFQAHAAGDEIQAPLLLPRQKHRYRDERLLLLHSCQRSSPPPSLRHCFPSPHSGLEKQCRRAQQVTTHRADTLKRPQPGQTHHAATLPPVEAFRHFGPDEPRP